MIGTNQSSEQHCKGHLPMSHVQAETVGSLCRCKQIIRDDGLLSVFTSATISDCGLKVLNLQSLGSLLPMVPTCCSLGETEFNLMGSRGLEAGACSSTGVLEEQTCRQKEHDTASDARAPFVPTPGQSGGLGTYSSVVFLTFNHLLSTKEHPSAFFLC